MKILFFASLKAKVGASSQDVSPPAHVATVIELVEWLRSQGGAYAEAFADLRTVRVAVNQEHAGFEAKIDQGDEIAFFPPVTGG